MLHRYAEATTFSRRTDASAGGGKPGGGEGEQKTARGRQLGVKTEGGGSAIRNRRGVLVQQAPKKMQIKVFKKT